MNQSSGLGVIVFQGAAASALLNVAFRPLYSSFLFVTAHKNCLHHRLSIILNRASHENVSLSIMIQSPTDKHGRSTVSSPNNNKSITLENVHPLSTHSSLYLTNILYIYLYMYEFFCLFLFATTYRRKGLGLIFCSFVMIRALDCRLLTYCSHLPAYKCKPIYILTIYASTSNLRISS